MARFCARSLLLLSLLSLMPVRVTSISSKNHKFATPPSVPEWRHLCTDGEALDYEPHANVLDGSDSVSLIDVVRTVDNVAYLWDQCRTPFKDFGNRHSIETVVSKKYSFMYLENRKVASSSIRHLFAKVLRMSWCSTDMPHASTESHHGLTLSSDFAEQDISQLFKFSLVRDPVEKFEAGVQQAWIQNPTLENMTADDMLVAQLSLPLGSWVDDHLQPSSFSLSAMSAAGTPVQVDFVGKLEQSPGVWDEIINKLSSLTDDQRGKLRVLVRSNNHNPDPRAKLSPESIKLLCASNLYGYEWTCFGYELPPECGRQSPASGR